MIDINVALVVWAKEIKGNGFYIFLVDNKLPETPLDFSCSSEFLASRLLFDYLNIRTRGQLDGGWVRIKQFDVYEESNCLTIPYVCIIPEKVTIVKNGQWVPLGSLSTMVDSKYSTLAQKSLMR